MLSTRTVSIVILLALSFTFDNAKAQDQSAQHSVYPLSRFQPGQWVEKVSGDFTKPGDPFVFRIHQDAGYITLPHTHPIDENITVVKGSWSLGMGRRFNRAALGTNGYRDVWDGAQEYGALCVVEDGNDFTDSRNRTVCVNDRRACVRAY